MYIIIPMAGKGSRFVEEGYSIPKPLIEVDGMTLAEHAITTMSIDGIFVFLTKNFKNPEHNKELTKIFNQNCKNFIEIRVVGEQLGAAHTALFAEKHIDLNSELIITNCDQHLSWDGDSFLNFISSKKDLDGAVVLYKSNNPKNSFAYLKDDKIINIVEKQAISQNALIGVHYWKKAKDFFNSANDAIKDYKNHGYPECYVSITYNYLIEENKNIYGYFIKNNEYQSLGTPKDVEKYNAGK